MLWLTQTYSWYISKTAPLDTSQINKLIIDASKLKHSTRCLFVALRHAAHNFEDCARFNRLALRKQDITEKQWNQLIGPH